VEKLKLKLKKSRDVGATRTDRDTRVGRSKNDLKNRNAKKLKTQKKKEPSAAN
jgi:hypothetical protein